MIRVRAFPRIHVTLVDLANLTSRRYGGIGFAIDGLDFEVTAERATAMRIHGAEALDETARADVAALLGRLQQFGAPPCAIRLGSLPRQHVGLGSKTALALGIVKAVTRLMDTEIDQETIQRLSGRGGASGVGIHTFFRGGVVVDGGHRRSSKPFRPSSSEMANSVPPLIAANTFPSEWRVTLILPEGERTSGKKERDFFASATPLPGREVCSILAAVFHGVLPAIAERNLSDFRLALGELRSTGFKAREVAAQRQAVRDTLRDIAMIKGAAVGMSSLGPLLFAVHQESDSCTAGELADAAAANRAAILGVFSGRNAGHEVEES